MSRWVIRLLGPLVFGDHVYWKPLLGNPRKETFQNRVPVSSRKQWTMRRCAYSLPRMRTQLSRWRCPSPTAIRSTRTRAESVVPIVCQHTPRCGRQKMPWYRLSRIRAERGRDCNNRAGSRRSTTPRRWGPRYRPERKLRMRSVSPSTWSTHQRALLWRTYAITISTLRFVTTHSLFQAIFVLPIWR